ncbi:uncharacterized protein LOC120885406 [Ictidomys tridecemlineatus]
MKSMDSREGGCWGRRPPARPCLRRRAELSTTAQAAQPAASGSGPGGAGLRRRPESSAAPLASRAGVTVGHRPSLQGYSRSRGTQRLSPHSQSAAAWLVGRRGRQPGGGTTSALSSRLPAPCRLSIFPAQDAGSPTSSLRPPRPETGKCGQPCRARVRCAATTRDLRVVEAAPPQHRPFPCQKETQKALASRASGPWPLGTMACVGACTPAALKVEETRLSSPGAKLSAVVQIPRVYVRIRVPLKNG